MAISVGGLATGLDTETIVSQLMTVERKPVTLLETRKLKFEALAAAFKDLNSRLNSLKTKVDALKDPASFFARSVTSSDDTVATATATNGTVRGTFTLATTALARGSIAAAAVTKSALTDTIAAGDGTFEFKLGTTGTVVSVDVTSTTTLDQLVAAINEKNAGVRATAVNTGTAAAPAYKLSITSNSTGLANDILIENDDTTLSITNTQGAADASFSITGLGAFTRASNTFSDVLDGVTITLKKANSTTDLSVKFDSSGTQTKIQGLIDGYNDVIRTIDGQTAPVTSADGTVRSGAFSGDAVPRVLRNGLATAIRSTLDGTFQRLADVGITTQKDGTLQIDSTKLQKALEDDPVAVSTLIAGTTSKDGIADLVAAKVDAATQALTGTIAARQDGITSSIQAIQKQIDSALARLATKERSLRERFANLELLIARTTATGEALMQQIKSLPGFKPLSKSDDSK
jgi:flagellar hook-associated protein 2